MKKWFNSTWKHCPALYLSLLFLVGIFSAFHLWGLLFLIFIPKKTSLPTSFFCLFLLQNAVSKFFPITVQGTALFHIEEVKPHAGPFASGLVYIGHVKSFCTTNKTWHRLPCRFYTNKTKKPSLSPM